MIFVSGSIIQRKSRILFVAKNMESVKGFEQVSTQLGIEK